MNLREKALICMEIADYMLDHGSHYTYSGNYHFEFEDIDKLFGTDLLGDDRNLIGVIVDIMMASGMLIEVDTDKDFDLLFGLDYCDHVDDIVENIQIRRIFQS